MKNINQVLMMLSLFFFMDVQGQIKEDVTLNELSFQDFIGFVKKHHPLVKQAGLKLKKGEAYLLKSRGGFDPKIEVDYSDKDLKKINYWKELNAVLKIPTWYGVEFKAAFEDNEGVFLNPNLTTPDGGLYSAGVSVALGQGFLINERMASLKKARFFKNESKASRDIAINEILYKASVAYFLWLEATNKEGIYASFVKNSEVRLKAVERSVAAGDKAEITISEAKINMQNRLLGLEEASRKRKLSALKLSNYLWLNSVPLELASATKPIMPKHIEVEESLLLNLNNNWVDYTNSHPKLKALDAKIDGLGVEVSLKKNKLLPKLNLNYNLLSEDAVDFSSYKTANYKAYVNFSLPLFLRKERGDLRLSKLKLEDIKLKKTSEKLIIKNKIEEAKINIASIKKQQVLIESMVDNYTLLVKAEERKFSLGESSLFLINYREEKLISAKIKGNSLIIKNLKFKAKLYNTLGIAM